MASLTHIVLFEFKEGAAPEAIKTACDKFLALKSTCIHPASQKPYILSLKGGKDNSPEGHQGGITHGFVVEFATAEDRDYYVNTDPTHRVFATGVKDLVAQVRVVDFTGGVF